MFMLRKVLWKNEGWIERRTEVVFLCWSRLESVPQLPFTLLLLNSNTIATAKLLLALYFVTSHYLLKYSLYFPFLNLLYFLARRLFKGLLIRRMQIALSRRMRKVKEHLWACAAASFIYNFCFQLNERSTFLPFAISSGMVLYRT